MAKQIPDRPPPWRTWDDFAKWFWKDKNSDELIDKLNTHAFKRKGATCQRIRKEQDSPTIYGVIVRDDMEVGDWKFCKVGSCPASGNPKTGNQLDQMINEIEMLDKEGKVLFNLPINFANSSKASAIEECIRKAVGYPVHKDLAQHLELPDPKGWVLTTLAYTRVLKEAMKKEMEMTLVSTKIFQKVRFDTTRAPELPNWLQIRDGKIVRKI